MNEVCEHVLLWCVCEVVSVRWAACRWRTDGLESGQRWSTTCSTHCCLELLPCCFRGIYTSLLLCEYLIPNSYLSFSLSCYWTYLGQSHMWYVHNRNRFHGKILQSHVPEWWTIICQFFMALVMIFSVKQQVEIAANPWLHQHSDWTSVYRSVYPAKRLQKNPLGNLCINLEINTWGKNWGIGIRENKVGYKYIGWSLIIN